MSIEKASKEIDLEVVDRVPYITPGIGDYVKIKSMGWFFKWKDSLDMRKMGFVEPMAIYCGQTLRVKNVEGSYTNRTFTLEGNSYFWRNTMFEDVYLDTSLSKTSGFLSVCDAASTIIDKDFLKSNLSANTVAVLDTTLEGALKRKEPELRMIKKKRFIKLKKI